MCNTEDSCILLRILLGILVCIRIVGEVCEFGDKGIIEKKDG